MSALSVSGLEVAYGRKTAVAGLDFAVTAGECFGLLGPNGAGKSSALGAILGLVRARRGQVKIFGASPRDLAVRERLGVVMQDTCFAPRLSVRETLHLFRSQYRSGRKVEELIDELGLSAVANQQVRSLSGGEHRLLAFAVALVGDPDLVVLDEPTAALDAMSRHRIWRVLTELRGRGVAILVSTHYLEEAEKLCDRVAIVDRGRQVLLGEPAAIVSECRAGRRVEVTLSGPISGDALARLPGVEQRGRTLSIEIGELAATLPEAIAAAEERGLQILGIESRAPSLETVFLRLLGGET